MDNFLVLKKGKKLSEVVCKVDDFFDREVMLFVLNKLEEGAFSEFGDDSDFDFVSEVFVVSLKEVKFKNLKWRRKYFEDEGMC